MSEVPTVVTSVNTLSDVRNVLCKCIADLADDTVCPKKAAAINNACGKVIKIEAIRLQLVKLACRKKENKEMFNFAIS